jgi:hypothetical protein
MNELGFENAYNLAGGHIRDGDGYCRSLKLERHFPLFLYLKRKPKT